MEVRKGAKRAADIQKYAPEIISLPRLRALVTNPTLAGARRTKNDTPSLIAKTESVRNLPDP